MTGPFTQVVFFFQFVCKMFDIYKCLEWNTNTRACKLFQLELSVRDYDWTIHPCSIFISIYCKKVMCLCFGESEYLLLTSDYHLSLILGAMTVPFNQVVFFFLYCLKSSKYELVILNLIMKRAWCWVKHFYLHFRSKLWKWFQNWSDYEWNKIDSLKMIVEIILKLFGNDGEISQSIFN